MDKTEELAGNGVVAQVDGKTVAAGNDRLMERMGISYTPNRCPGTIVYVAVDGKFAGSIVISDKLKPTSKAAVKELQAQGVRTVLLTGDNNASAQAVGARLALMKFTAAFCQPEKWNVWNNSLRKKRQAAR